MITSGRWTKILKARGFSLTEVMVGGAILAGVGLAGARMFKDQKVAQKKVEHDATLTSFHNSVVKHMQNANNCNATFYGAGYYGRSGGAWPAPPAIYGCDSCELPANKELDFSPMDVPRNGSPWLVPGQWIDGTNTWRIESWTMTAPSGTGKGTLKILYRQAPHLGGKSLYKDVNLNMRFSQDTTPAFRDCLSGNESAINNLQNDVCNSMTTQFGSTGVIMRWDDNTQKCVRIGEDGSKVKQCPAGSVVEGIRADGSVHCKSLVQGVVPGQDLMKESAINCGSGQTKLEIVDGKLVTSCL